MNSDILRLYSEVILQGALSIKKGDRLWLRCEPVHSRFAGLLAEKAYEIGAEYVKVDFSDPYFNRLRVDKSVSEDFLDYVPGYTSEMYKSVVEEGWRSLALRGPSNPDVMQGADPARLGRMTKAASIARRGFLQAISSNAVPWNVCLVPTEKWARKVLGEESSGGQNQWEKKIWEILLPILRLDREDPVQAWKEHDCELKRRASFLNEKKFKAFRFHGPGTDLTVGMRRDRKFCAGSGRSADGTVFFPNIPTEEVFSTPDMNATSGRVACTRPVTVLGAQVEGAWFTFKEGRVVDYGAEKNGEVLGKYIETDPGAAMLGEIALVGTDSPIYRSGYVFHNILFDENAACHIALGNGYTDCIQGGTEMSPDELSQAACNQSLVHTDFMIGSEKVSVAGISEDGSELPIIIKGEFAI